METKQRTRKMLAPGMMKRILKQTGFNLVLLGATIGALWVMKDFAFMENFHFPSAFIAIGIMALLNTFKAGS